MVNVTTQAPSSDMLLYLFSDKLVPPANLLTGSVSAAGKVPCRDVKVNVQQRAILLFAAAFWSLEEQGLVRLEVVHKKSFGLFPSTRVQVTQVQQAQRPGLEGAILRSLSWRGEDSASGVIVRWFDQDVSSPYTDVIDASLNDVIAYGYITAGSSQPGQPSERLMGLHQLQPNCAQIASLETMAEEVVAGFKDFQARRPELYEALVKQCKSGIETRRESKDDSS